MKYICHSNYEGKTIDNFPIEIKRGKELTRTGNFLYYAGIAICVYRSLVGKQHFAIDEDGKGLERGDYTHLLAYDPRTCHGGNSKEGPIQRFTDEEIKLIREKHSDWIKDSDWLLFNDKFFEEDVDKLKNFSIEIGLDTFKPSRKYFFMP